MELRWRWIIASAALALHALLPALLALDPTILLSMLANPRALGRDWLISAACWTLYGFLLGLGAEAFQRWTRRRRSAKI